MFTVTPFSLGRLTALRAETKVSSLACERDRKQVYVRPTVKMSIHYVSVITYMSRKSSMHIWHDDVRE